jgi:hypothetical protein
LEVILSGHILFLIEKVSNFFCQGVDAEWFLQERHIRL